MPPLVSQTDHHYPIIFIVHATTEQHKYLATISIDDVDSIVLHDNITLGSNTNDAPPLIKRTYSHDSLANMPSLTQRTDTKSASDSDYDNDDHTNNPFDICTPCTFRPQDFTLPSEIVSSLDTHISPETQPLCLTTMTRDEIHSLVLHNVSKFASSENTYSFTSDPTEFGTYNCATQHI